MDSSNPEQFIQYREQLLTRLREVIPVLSQQMFSARNKRGEQRAVLKPEAARILKNLSVELREAGLCCIESIARWMLTQQRSSSAPTYLWQGQDYILKMYTDLDFVVEALGAYAARIGCFSKQNPLLLTKADLSGVGSRPNLSRVYGALLILLDVVARHRREAASPAPEPSTEEEHTEVPAQQANATAPPSPRSQGDNVSSPAGQTAKRSPQQSPRELEQPQEVQRIPHVPELTTSEARTETEPPPVKAHEAAQTPRRAGDRDEGTTTPTPALNGDISQKVETPREPVEESQNYDDDDFDVDASSDASSAQLSRKSQEDEVQQPPPIEYKMLRELGRGAFAQVWECEMPSLGRIAVKFLLHDEDEDEETQRYTKRSWEQELRLLREFKHPHIIEFLVEVFHPEHGTGIGCESAECNLLTVIDAWDARRATKYAVVTCDLLRQIGSAVQYLHDKNLMHRDIKPENVLVKLMQPIEDYLNGEEMVLRKAPTLLLCDFGTTRQADQRPMQRIDAKSTYVGSRWYRAPELLFNGERYTQAVDMWALGTMAVELMLGTAPFQGAQEIDVMRSMVEMLGAPPASALECLSAAKWSEYTAGQGMTASRLSGSLRTSPVGDALSSHILGLLSYDFRERLGAAALVTKMEALPIEELVTKRPGVDVDVLFQKILGGEVTAFTELSHSDMTIVLRRVVDALDERLTPVLKVAGEAVASSFEGGPVAKAKALLESKVELNLTTSSEIRRLLVAGQQILELASQRLNTVELVAECTVSQLVCSLSGLLLHDTSSTALAELRSMMQICGLPSHFEGYTSMLNASAKSILLQLMQQANGFSKLPAVISRDDVFVGLDSIVQQVLLNSHARTTHPFTQIYPYFESEHSRKVVDGVNVEEGEGLGPMKELYQLCGQRLHRVWKQTGSGTVTAVEGSPQLIVHANPPLLNIGTRLEVQGLNDGSTWSVVVMAVLGDGKVRVERPAPHDLDNSAVAIYQRDRNALELLSTGDATINPRLTEDSQRDIGLLRQAGALIGLALLNRMALGLSIATDALDRVLSLQGPRDDSLHWAERQCHEGFYAVVNAPSFQLLGFSTADVHSLLRGSDPTSEFSFFDTFFVNYDQEVARSAPLQQSIHDCLQSLTASEKRTVLKFITGTARAPPRKTEHLHISVAFFAYTDQERRNLVHWLPHTHTCDNILQIPNYWEGILAQNNLEEADLTDEQAQALRKQLDALLREKLLQAATLCDTYGLDGLMASSPRRSTPLPDRIPQSFSPQQTGNDRTRHFDLSFSEHDVPEAQSVALGSPELSARLSERENQDRHAEMADQTNSARSQQSIRSTDHLLDDSHDHRQHANPTPNVEVDDYSYDEDDFELEEDMLEEE